MGKSYTVVRRTSINAPVERLLVGPDFERGLAQLKRAAEAG